jgi:membrane protein required for colicin V production
MALSAFDVAVGIFILISAILATYRGLIRELLSLATWAGAAGIAAYLYFNQPPEADTGTAAAPDQLASIAWEIHRFGRGIIDDPLVAALGIVVVSFLVAVIVLHLLTMWVADVVGESKLGPLDRTLGFVFGALRGLLIAIVFVVFGSNLFALRDHEWFRDSKSWPTLEAWGDQLIERLPGDLPSQINQLLGRDDDEGPADEALPEPADAAISDQEATAG